MSLQVIIISPAESDCDPFAAWMPEFARLDWVPVRAKSLKQADYCIKSYPNAVIVSVIAPASADAVAQLAEVRRMAGEREVIALCTGMQPICAASLADAGANFVLPPGAPFTLFKSLVELVRESARARSGDACGESARALAAESRKLLHDINQPLAVLQGRIQIFCMKAAPDAPERATYALLKEQAERAGEIVAQLHELHRKYK